MRLFSIVMIMLIAFAQVLAEEQDSNVEIIGKVLEQRTSVFQSMLSGVHDQTIKLIAEGTNDANDIILSYLASILQKNGQQVKIAAATDTGGIILSFKVLDINITYNDLRRKLMVGSQVVDRRLKLSLILTLTNADGKVVSSRSMSIDNEDELSVDKAVLYQNANFKFSNPKLPESHSSILEPIVVTGIVGTLIYIFYANKRK
jgi:hypothetical protein